VVELMAERRSSLDQKARLAPAAAAELDQFGRAGERHDLGRRRLQDRLLGARRIVLGKVANAVEKVGAAVVVEKAARQGLGRGAQAVDHVGRAVRGYVELRQPKALDSRRAPRRGCSAHHSTRYRRYFS